MTTTCELLVASAIIVGFVAPSPCSAQKLYLICTNTTIEDHREALAPDIRPIPYPIPFVNPMHVTVDFTARTVGGVFGGTMIFARDPTEDSIDFKDQPNAFVNGTGFISRIDGALSYAGTQPKTGKSVIITGSCRAGTQQF